jgi:hypothetical protein
VTRLSVPLDQAIEARRRARQAIRFPLRNRWLVFKVRLKVHLADLWTELKYLVRG